MIYLTCGRCHHGLRVSPGQGGEAEHLFHNGALPCWKCRAPLSRTAFEEMGVDYVDVTPQEALAAIHGLGLPGEGDCAAEAVAKLLTEKSIEKVGIRQIRNSHRSIIDYLELEDGTRVYLGSSSYGATVYRIAPRHSYVEANDGEG